MKEIKRVPVFLKHSVVRYVRIAPPLTLSGSL